MRNETGDPRTTPYVEIMKRELVVFSVIGGLLWAATGLSVLAVTFFDNGPRSSILDQTLVAEASDLSIDDSNQARAFANARSRDAETSAPLCETPSSDTSQPRTLGDSDLRSAGAEFTNDETKRCWHHNAISILHFCLLLT